MASLTVLDGPQTGRNYELRRGENTLGRHPECHVLIEVGAVSRRHAQVTRDGERWFVQDLNSRNGTFVNEQKVVGRVPLLHGDQLRVCDVSFKFHDDLQPAAFTPKQSDSSSVGTIFLDDEAESASSTIMSQVDVSSNRGQVQLSASPEAKLNALIEIMQSLGKALALDEVLPKVLDSLFKIFVQADRAFIGLNKEDGVLVPRWSKTRREEAEDTIRVSRTIVNVVMQSRKAILSADAMDDSRFQMAQSITDFRIRSMMCAPLIDSDGVPMGVLHIDTLDQRNRFQQEDLELLISAASQAGIAIDNAKLHDAALRQVHLENDIKLASDVQKAFLPDSRPVLESYEFFDFYEPANQIGGDYYDYIHLPDGRTAVVVADVVGHGVAAALLMAKLSAETKFCLASEALPDKAITNLNSRLSRLGIDRFVTLVLAVLDPQTHEVTIVNAGHMPPIHCKPDGELDEPGGGCSGLPLGIADGFEYESTVISLGAGESLTMYTDGINEAMNEQEQYFTMDRIRGLVANGPRDMAALGSSIVNDVQRFLGRSAQDDDMCLVCLRRLPSPRRSPLPTSMASATP